MKVTSLVRGSGKVGEMVLAQSGGECISREYRKNIANPNTEGQVNQRARMKLMSQLAAAMAPVIVIPKKGLVSARNQFISKNFNFCSSNDGIAQITLDNIQITAGTTGLPGISAERNGTTDIAVSLRTSAALAADRVVYVMFVKTLQNTLQYKTSVIVETAGANGTFPSTLPYVKEDAVIYAYGMKDLNSAASARYNNYNVTTGQDIASLMMERKISLSDYLFTQTRGAELYAEEQEIPVPEPGQHQVFLTASGPGTCTGAGIYNAGARVKVQAIPDAGAEFIGWRENGMNRIFSNSPTQIFTIENSIDWVAVFRNPESSTGGEPGTPVENPLPYAYAEVHIDGQTALIQTGEVTLTTEFDSIGISNVGIDHTIVYVPEGSFLGAADNIELVEGGTMDDDYGFDSSNTGSGAIYFDGSLFFYIIVETAPAQQVTIGVRADPAAGGTISGAGNYNIGAQVTLVATPATGYHFGGWYENSRLITTDATYQFNANADRTILASFDENAVFPSNPTIVIDGHNCQLDNGVVGYTNASNIHNVTLSNLGVDDAYIEISHDEDWASDPSRAIFEIDDTDPENVLYKVTGFDAYLPAYVIYEGEIWFRIIYDE